MFVTAPGARWAASPVSGEPVPCAQATRSQAHEHRPDELAKAGRVHRLERSLVTVACVMAVERWARKTHALWWLVVGEQPLNLQQTGHDMKILWMGWRTSVRVGESWGLEISFWLVYRRKPDWTAQSFPSDSDAGKSYTACSVADWCHRSSQNWSAAIAPKHMRQELMRVKSAAALSCYQTASEEHWLG